MRRRFREDKATQAAAKLLRLGGGRMSHLKLIKLLYLVERESLTRFGAPLTNDNYVSMPHGPVLSATLDRINERESYENGYWDTHISPKTNHEVSLRDPAVVPSDQLSRAEEDLITEIFQRYGHMSPWKLRDLTHELPEWVNPEGSSIPIARRDILRSEGYTDEDIEEIEADLDAAAYAAAHFG
jgi:uncharacterized phage-associated protein